MDWPGSITEGHERLYRELPTFVVPCIPGCHDCCGPVPFSCYEWSKVEHRGPTPEQREKLACPYLSDHGCEIYAKRPFMCRAYGCFHDLRCPHGCGPAAVLGPEATALLMQKYTTLVGFSEKWATRKRKRKR